MWIRCLFPLEWSCIGFSQWRHPSCLTSTGHRFGLCFLFRSLVGTSLDYVILHPVASQSVEAMRELSPPKIELNYFMNIIRSCPKHTETKKFRDDPDSNPRPWAWLENREIDALDCSTTTAQILMVFINFSIEKSTKIMSGQVIFEIEKTEEKSRLSLNQLQWGMRHSGFFSSPILLSSFTPLHHLLLLLTSSGSPFLWGFSHSPFLLSHSTARYIKAVRHVTAYSIN